jgi:ferredoxin
MHDPPRLPDGLRLVRTTPEFTATTTPAGLRAAHRVAAGVWGRLRVLEGRVRFVFEGPPPSARELIAGEAIDIPPDTAHHVEPAAGCRFVVEFHADRG